MSACDALWSYCRAYTICVYHLSTLSCSVRVLPFRPVTRNDLDIWPVFEQVHAHAPQSVHAPLRITRVAKVVGKERLEVCRESAIYDCVSCATHHSCLEDDVVLCQSWCGRSESLLEQGKVGRCNSPCAPAVSSVMI